MKYKNSQIKFHFSRYNFLFLRSIFLATILFQIAKCGSPQKRLLQKLFKNLNRLERPVENESSTLQVYLGMAVQQIVNIDEKMQNIVFSGWLDMSWHDYNLKWNPNEYGNITKIRLPVERIWIPDILLYNSADDSFDSTSKVNAVVEHTGDVSYIPPGMFKSTCTFKIRDFPFDKQICSLKFGSWTYDELYINLTNKSDRGQNDSYIKNAEWILESILSYRISISYDCCPDKYPAVMFEIYIKRRTLYYEFNLIFPCILISCLTLLGFSLPPDSGEKIGLEVTVLLVIITFSQIISDSIPASSLSVSRIGLYFMSVMLISSLSILANIFVLIFHHRNVKINKYMSKWVEVFICEYLARMLRMKTPFDLKAKDEYKRQSIQHETSNNDDEDDDDFDNFSQSTNSKNFLSDDFNEDDNETDDNCSFDLVSKSQISKKLKENQTKSNRIQIIKSQKGLSNRFDGIQYKNGLVRKNSNLSQSIYENSNDIFLSIRTDFGSLKGTLNAILKEIRFITRKIQEDEEYEEKELKCKFAAVVIDRLCMVIFSILIFLSTAIIFTADNFLGNSDPSLKF